MPLTKRLLLALAAGLVAVLVAAHLQVALADSDEEGELTETLTLHPGDSFIGWVAEAKPVADLFAEIPQAQLIYRWEADSRTYHFATRDGGGNLETLQPGMAAKIRISGSRTVEWERPLTPAKGMVTLYSGENWVAWNGRDGWPLDQVARGIGTSVLSIEVRGQVYQPDSDVSEVVGSLTGEATIRRGDALRITVNRDLRWLQPTGMMPKIVWVGDVSQSLRDEITGDVRTILDLFAEILAVESDFSQTTILFFHDVDAAVKHEESGAEPHFGYPPEQLRTVLMHNHQAATTLWGFYMSTCAWRPPIPESCLHRSAETLAHEWFHMMQNQFTVGEGWRASPTWIAEGAAMWLEGQLPSELKLSSYENDRDRRLEATARTSVKLASLEDRNDRWPYQIGPIAIERLTELSGADAILEFDRRLHPQIIGAERRWLRSLSWHEAFEAAFGLSVPDFYGQFAAWRETLPSPRLRYDYDHGDVTLSGTLSGSDRSRVTGFQLTAATVRDEFVESNPRTTFVDEDGAFSIDVEPETMQRIRFTRDGCTLWLTDNGLTTRQPEAGHHHDLDTRKLPKLDLTLPEGACENELRLSVLPLRGDERIIEINLNSEDGQRWITSRTSVAGTYTAFAPESGNYRVRVLLGDCPLWYTSAGLGASRPDGQLLGLGKQPMVIDTRVPYDLCLRQASGHLIREDGEPARGVELFMSVGPTYSWGTTSVDGSFNITVPDAGDYALSFWSEAGGCRIIYAASRATSDWSQATAITVADDDITGIDFVVPNDPASLCE